MDQVEQAFRDVMDEFLDSAQTEEQLSLFTLISTMGWNLSIHPEEEWPGMLRTFIERFGCPSYTVGGETLDTRQKVLELCRRKMTMCPDIRHVIRELEVEDHRDGLKYSVLRVE